ncbi:MAG: hypothetical protein ACC618_00090 [Patescibacteria group bacterium]
MSPERGGSNPSWFKLEAFIQEKKANKEGFTLEEASKASGYKVNSLKSAIRQVAYHHEFQSLGRLGKPGHYKCLIPPESSDDIFFDYRARMHSRIGKIKKKPSIDQYEGDASNLGEHPAGDVGPVRPRRS